MGVLQILFSPKFPFALKKNFIEDIFINFFPKKMVFIKCCVIGISKDKNKIKEYI